MHDDIRDKLKNRAPLMERIKDSLEGELKSIFRNTPHIDRVAVRVKGDESLLNKAIGGRYSAPLIEIEDQIGARVIVFFLSDIEIVKQEILRYFIPMERKSVRPSQPESFAYESEHLILTINESLIPDHGLPADDIPRTFEMQIRTILMHAYAEPQHDMVYKRRNPISFEMQRRNAWIAASCWGADREFEEIRRWCESNP